MRNGRNKKGCGESGLLSWDLFSTTKDSRKGMHSQAKGTRFLGCNEEGDDEVLVDAAPSPDSVAFFHRTWWGVAFHDRQDLIPPLPLARLHSPSSLPTFFSLETVCITNPFLIRWLGIHLVVNECWDGPLPFCPVILMSQTCSNRQSVLVTDSANTPRDTPTRNSTKKNRSSKVLHSSSASTGPPDQLPLVYKPLCRRIPIACQYFTDAQARPTLPPA